MNKEYFYNMGVKDGNKAIGGPKSYEDALALKAKNISKKYGLENAQAYKDGLLSVIIPYKKGKNR